MDKRPVHGLRRLLGLFTTGDAKTPTQSSSPTTEVPGTPSSSVPSAPSQSTVVSSALGWSMKTAPTPLQTEILHWAVNRWKRGIPILIPMGLGKSRASLEICWGLSRRNILVVCPKSLFSGWKKQIHIHTHYTVTECSGNPRKRQSILADLRSNCILINPEGIRSLSGYMSELGIASKFDAIIVDELTRFRRWSQQTRALSKLIPDIPCRIGLSGGLVTENLTDVFNPMKLLDGGRSFGTNFFDFREKYFLETTEDEDGEPIEYPKYVPTDQGKAFVKAVLHKNTFFRTEDQVCGSLPPARYTTHRCTMTKEQRAMLTELKEEMAVTVEGEVYEFKYILQVLIKQHQISSGFLYREDDTTYFFQYHPKLQTIQSLLEEVGTGRFLIWCVYKAEQELLWKFLQNYKIHTGDPADFNYSGCQGMVLTYAKDAEGHNLQGAKHSIEFSTPLAYNKVRQARGRNRRLDSEHDCLSYTTLTTDTPIDRLLMRAHSAKKDLIDYLEQDLTNPTKEIWRNP